MEHRKILPYLMTVYMTVMCIIIEDILKYLPARCLFLLSYPNRTFYLLHSVKLFILALYFSLFLN